MTDAVSCCFLSTVALFSLSAIGCQSIHEQRSASFGHQQDEIRTVKSEQSSETRSAVVTLSREIHDDGSDADSGQLKRSLWSRLQTPTRILLPRTDTSEGTVLEEAQGLDDGF